MKTKEQQEAILAAVCTMRTHPTADEIYDKLKKDFPRLSLGTVYRNLNSFAQKGDIRRVSVPDGGYRFDFRIDKHHHLLCDNCGRLFDIEAKVQVEAEASEVVLKDYTLFFHGLCLKCKG